MQNGERIQEGPMVFLRGGHFCLNLMPHSLRTVSSTGVIAEHVLVFPSYDTSILYAKPVILISVVV